MKNKRDVWKEQAEKNKGLIKVRTNNGIMLLTLKQLEEYKKIKKND